jgi:hypothetical protein
MSAIALLVVFVLYVVFVICLGSDDNNNRPPMSE